MTETIRFTNVADGSHLGDVTLAEGQLVADPPVQSVVDAHLERGDPPEDFMAMYDGWSNGYMMAGRVVKLRPVKERDAALKEHYERTMHSWDEKSLPPDLEYDGDE